MTLDLSGRTPLNPENSRRLEEIAVKLRPRVVELLDRVSYRNMVNIDWWVSPTASRNPFTGRFFLSCCRIFLLESLLALNKVPSQVLVDSREMAVLAGSLEKKYRASFRIRIVGAMYWRNLVGIPVRNILASLFHQIVPYIFSRVLLSRPVFAKNEPLILIDTFLYSESLKDGIFQDRHFPGIRDALNTVELQRLRYFPTCYKIRNYPGLLWRLRSARAMFFLKEDFLKFGDYIFAFAHIFRAGRVDRTVSMEMDGLNLGGLFQEDLLRGRTWPGAIESLLKYRAIRRMSESGVKITRVLDWFENQDIDRGANAGYRRFYPGIEVVGYIGFVASQHYLCMYPTAAELEAKVLPTRIAVMGRGFVETIKEFCPDMAVEVAPALRYPVRIPSTIYSSKPNKLTMLVALPVVRAEALEILDAVRHFVQGLEGTSLETVEKQILIKPHPASDISRDDTFSTQASSKIDINWVDEKLDSLLLNCDVLVSVASSACFEALAMGVPVVVFGSGYGLTYIPIPQPIPPERWRVCYSWEEMLSAIMEFRTNDVSAARTESSAARQLQEEYLETVSRKGIRHLVLGADNE